MPHPSEDLPEAALDALVARERTRVITPLTEWRTLSAQLRDEGLIRSPGEPSAASFEAVRRRSGVSHRGLGMGVVQQWGLRVATGAALLGTGVVVGLGWSAGTPVGAAIRAHMQMGAVDTVAANDTDTGSSHGATVAERGDPSPPHEAEYTYVKFTSPEVAKQVLLRSQMKYQQAAAYLAASDTSAQIVTGATKNPAVAYQVRLAGLNVVLMAMEQALKEAPHDPLLHQYYASTIGAREATEQQLVQALPVGTRVSHY